VQSADSSCPVYTRADVVLTSHSTLKAGFQYLNNLLLCCEKFLTPMKLANLTIIKNHRSFGCPLGHCAVQWLKIQLYCKGVYPSLAQNLQFDRWGLLTTFGPQNSSFTQGLLPILGPTEDFWVSGAEYKF
jgi:hypothetical protein